MASKGNHDRLRYPLRNRPLEYSTLCPPLQRHRRPTQTPARNSLVSGPPTSSSMAGDTGEPEVPKTVDEKLDKLLAQIATINERMDSHDHRLTRTEQLHD
ncbi:hypothetical protein E2562_029281 [Oryza meyeriana var. granulata]|uniref:Uncharacterized protein n=1 Tax=Oryza meyeriana var. granulata TaxID=110450 RepID=A0A6G1BPA9_9ORYZ|nr:hypothetical protein E2562_029281 [Oryza meyeriana var. granulata]